MKKILLAGLLFAGLGAQAQISLGPKVGGNYSTVFTDAKNSDTKSVFGFHFGMFLEMKLTEKFAIQPEVLYSRVGKRDAAASIQIGGVKLSGDVVSSYDYVNVPVLGRFYVAEGFALELGPQFGFLAKSVRTYSGSINDSKTEKDQDLKDFMEPFEFGVSGGFTYDISNSGLFLGARYNYGVTNIYKKSTLFTEKANNSNIQLSLGYRF